MREINCKIQNKLKTLGRIISFWYDSRKYRVRVLSPQQTIRYVLRNRCSVARFGDGELNMILTGKNIGFQKNDPELANQLKKVLCTNDPNLLVCLPHCFSRFHGENQRAKEFWIDFLEKNRVKIVEMLYSAGMKGYRFGDTQMTRPYIDYIHKNTSRVYSELKKLWDRKDVIIVEGCATRMGIGNDLFDNARSIKRIVCPAENAFSSYNEIKNTVIEYSSKKLVLLALGPTATVLASDLSKAGIWAIDVGHLDIEYEWYKRGALQKSPIEGKYVNEVPGGNYTGGCLDKKYLSQIITRI